jgi:Antirestriction protein (ArdA)
MTDGASTASPAFLAYNNRYLHGAWTDADQDTNAIRAEINAMLASLARRGRGRVPPFTIMTASRASTFPNTRASTPWARIAAFIAEHGNLGAGVLEQFSGSIDEAETALQDCYLGQSSSLADYMEELTTGWVTISEPLRNISTGKQWRAMPN